MCYVFKWQIFYKSIERKNVKLYGPYPNVTAARKTIELLKETDSYKELEEIEKKIKSKLRVVLGLDAKISLESPNTLQRFEGKAKRVKDLREGI